MLITLNTFNLSMNRVLLAVFALAIYALMCGVIARKHVAKRRATIRSLDSDSSGWQIVYASQTGTAEELAQQTASTLQLAGIGVQLRGLSDLDVNTLGQNGRILFIVSTYGEGNPPDNAARFAQHVMSSAHSLKHSYALKHSHPLEQLQPLKHLHYAMLALGDRSYTHFCGFGRELDQWLQVHGAQQLFPTLEANQADARTIETWRNQLSHIVGTNDAPDWEAPRFDAWRLVTRQLLNPGSHGNGVFHLEFEPIDASLPTWEAGDLVQVQTPIDPTRAREYSIASIPDDGRIHLLIRLHQHMDGSFGAASGWLTQTITVGDSIALRLRRHERFRLGNNIERPLILIGNGSGMAGLRSHLKARARRGIHHNWLIFGERNARCDFLYRNDIETWQRTGILERLDMVFSRDQSERRYVQDRLLEVDTTLRAWINQGAAIYVCGSLRGMASGVDEVLTAILGRAVLDELSLAGRYRRDVY